MLHREHRHRIVLDAPVARIFPLFTPRGELGWVPGWDPEFLHPQSGETAEGMVFRTRIGGEDTLWACVLWDEAAHRVRYVRVTPASRFVFVEVACRALAPEQAEVWVGYTLTALTPAGEATLADLTPEAFAQMIDGWRARITEMLARESA